MMAFSKTIIITITFCLLTASICQAKVYTACEFATQMKNNGVTSTADLGTWTCIASHESGFSTTAISATSDYGILQISAYYWCSASSTPGNGCGITCASLLDDDISNDIACAELIYGQKGFSAWTTYASCQGDQTSYISGCGL